MRILDENNVEIRNPDENLGYLTEERLLAAHHDAVEAVPSRWHYEVERVYPNGGRDLKRVVDVPGVKAQPEWDEFEDILRYIRYTPEELAARNAPSQLDYIEAQVMYTALMTDTLLEE